jgi:3-hydroxyacyl-[acyl-carrier-protein] dehydratase
VSLPWSDEAEALFAKARKTPLLAAPEATLVDRAGIERVLPHRDPFLLLDRVTLLDNDRIAARYDLARARDVLAGHFPGHPVWPGVLQVEAIAQAGCFLQIRSAGAQTPAVALTHVLGAQFIRPVEPGGEVEIQATVLEEGMLFTVVGQCLRRGEVCSAAVVCGLAGD